MNWQRIAVKHVQAAQWTKPILATGNDKPSNTKGEMLISTTVATAIAIENLTICTDHVSTLKDYINKGYTGFCQTGEKSDF